MGGGGDAGDVVSVAQCGVCVVCPDRHTTDQSEATEGFSPAGMSRLLWRYGAFQTEKRSENKIKFAERSEQAGTQARPKCLIHIVRAF